MVGTYYTMRTRKNDSYYMDKETPMTPAELSEILWGKYPEHQKRANLAFLEEVFAYLKIGGVWMWPETRRLFRKVNERELVEIYE